MATAAILNFQKFENLTTSPLWGTPTCVTVPNIVKIGPTVAEIWRSNFFSKWRPSAIFNGWMVKLHHHGDGIDRRMLARVLVCSTSAEHLQTY